MPTTATATETKLATHQRVAVSFIIGTATMVLMAVAIAGVITLVTNQPAPAATVPSADQTFQT